MTIDIRRLRNDIKDYYGTAAFNGSPVAMVDLIKVDNMTDQEVFDYALKKRMEVEKYIVQE